MAWGTGTERYFHGSDSKIRHHSTYSLTLASGSYSFLDLGTQKTSRSKNRETGKRNRRAQAGRGTVLVSEEKLRSITENSSDHIMLVGQDLKILFINKTVPGLKKEDVIGKNINDFVPKGFQKLTYDKFQSVLKTGKPTNYQTEYLTAKGETNYFDVRLSPITREGKVVSVVSSANDVTERKQIEEKLKKHREHLEELVKERTRELGEKNVELERFNKLFINREFRIKELKKSLENMSLKLRQDLVIVLFD